MISPTWAHTRSSTSAAGSAATARRSASNWCGGTVAPYSWEGAARLSEIRPLVAVEHQRAAVVITYPHVLWHSPRKLGSPVREKTRSVAGTQNIVCYVGRMDRFLVPAAASIVVGLLLGAAAIFGVTLMVQQDSKPPLQAGDPASSVLNRVEYGDRT